MSAPRLVAFTRYPAPGRAKTRLIPRLGPRGASALQRWMTARLLARAGALARRRRLDLEVRFSGGSAARMAALFGAGHRYVSQGRGDLGARMARAVRRGFADGAPAVVIVGTDVPGVTGRTLAAAFTALRQHDVVLGPAVDGGYYLVGLRRPVPGLFSGMPWGTSAVLRRTVSAARRSGATLALLASLADVDEPADVTPALLRSAGLGR